MKLVVEITDSNGAYSIEPYFKTDREDDYVRNDLSQAEEVARLTKVSQEIERTVNAYYSMDSAYDDYGNPIPVSLKETCKQ